MQLMSVFHHRLQLVMFDVPFHMHIFEQQLLVLQHQHCHKQ